MSQINAYVLQSSKISGVAPRKVRTRDKLKAIASETVVPIAREKIMLSVNS